MLTKSSRSLLPRFFACRGTRICGREFSVTRLIPPVLIWLAAFFFCPPAVPQTFPNNIFERIGLEQGLSNTTVTSILQDSRGFLWFGTQEGLNRYDGYSFTVYKHDLQDSTSIGSNRILSLMEDRSGLLWIGTSDAGLDCYDRNTGQFRHFRNRAGDAHSMSYNQVETIYEDRRGVIWAGTLDGLNRLDRKSGKVTRYYADLKDPHTLGSANIGCIMEDSDGNLWVASADYLNRYVPATDSFIRYSPKDNLYFIGSVLERKDGCFWIASWGNGLWVFDRRTGRFTAIRNDPGNPNSLRCNYIGHLRLDPKGNLWIGTNEGLDFLRDGSGEFTHFISDPLDDKSISTNGIWGLCLDRTGILWVGTYQGGVNKLVPPRAVFTHYRHDDRNPKSLDNDKVITIFESRDGEIWIGTEHGLSRFNRKTGAFTVLHHSPGNPNTISSDYVNTVWEDRKGTIWIGTSRGGFCLFDRMKNTFRTFRAVPTDSTRLPDDWVNCFFQEPNGKIWIGSYSGLTVFDPETERFSRFSSTFPMTPGRAASRSVNTVLKDNRGRCFWIGSYIGLFRYDQTRKELLRYPSDPSDPETLSNDQVRCLYLDGKGRLWIGTALGLNRFDRATGKFARYTKREGLSNEVINGISGDARGNIWVITNGVVSRLEPETGKIANFDANDGIPFPVFNERALLCTHDGSFFVGGTEGFFTFHPDSLKPGGLGPPMAITSFKVFNSETDTGGKPISEMNRMVLSRGDTFFSFEFAALDYSAPSRNVYAYRMEGFDRDWVQAGNRRYASYTNLDPGKYVFRVKGANKDGVWSVRDASLEIVILPPFWMTWWFRILAGLTLIGSALGVHYFRMNVIRRQKKKLEELVLTRTRELTEKQTQLVEKQEQLGRSEELYRGLVETSPDAILIVNPEGIIRMANPRASEMLAGGLATDLRGCALRDFLAPGERERFERLLHELSDTEVLHNVQLTIDKGKGLFLPVELNALLIHDQEDFRCIGILRDISERLRAEEERVERERLRGVVETAGGACHELNQPLQAIMGYVEILLMDRENRPEKRDYLKKVYREAGRMGEITRQLMNITKFQTKRYAGDTRIIDLDRSSDSRPSSQGDDGE